MDCRAVKRLDVNSEKLVCEELVLNMKPTDTILELKQKIKGAPYHHNRRCAVHTMWLGFAA